jgi:hypothetical protein
MVLHAAGMLPCRLVESIALRKHPRCRAREGGGRKSGNCNADAPSAVHLDARNWRQRCCYLQVGERGHGAPGAGQRAPQACAAQLPASVGAWGMMRQRKAAASAPKRAAHSLWAAALLPATSSQVRRRCSQSLQARHGAPGRGQRSGDAAVAEQQEGAVRSAGAGGECVGAEPRPDPPAAPTVHAEHACWLLPCRARLRCKGALTAW